MESESFKSPQESALNIRELKRRYAWELLPAYIEKFNELKKIRRKNPGGLTDPEIKAQMNFIDQERHQIHLQLIELGAKLGKNKTDVLMDIIKEECSLEEFGLPEFSIKTEENEINWDTNALKQGEILLIFDITNCDEGGAPMYEEDHEERKKRAEALIKEMGGRLIEETEGAYHETVYYLGITLPKENLEKVAAIIRDNPKKFRLGKEFYE